MGTVRKPAVAGQFYTDDPAALRSEVSGLIKKEPARGRVTGIVSPHAGYVYSGGVAGHLYGAILVPGVVVILGPNHHGYGARIALSPDEEWLTPLGKVPVARRLGDLLKEEAPSVEDDRRAHALEHSLEVQLPFLQAIRPDVEILPLCLGFGDSPTCHLLGGALARAITNLGEDVLIVASSDMTHYESAAAAKEKDDLALGKLLELDAEGLLAVCRRYGITMCGVVPAAVMLVAARELGASSARLVRYATSGDVTGDLRRVVAYAGVTVF